MKDSSHKKNKLYPSVSSSSTNVVQDSGSPLSSTSHERLPNSCGNNPVNIVVTLIAVEGAVTIILLYFVPD